LYAVWQTLGDGHRGRGSRRKSFSLDTVLVRVHRLLFGRLRYERIDSKLVCIGGFTEDSKLPIIGLLQKLVSGYQDYVKGTGNGEYVFKDKNSQRRLKQKIYADLVKLHTELKDRRLEK
jgi:hypothetical protein